MTQFSGFLITIGITPNRLSLFRLIGAIFLIIPLWRGYYVSAFVTFLLLAITDILDGWLARKAQLITELGKFLDRAADKALLLTALFFLMPVNFVTIWIILFSAELALFWLSALAYGDATGQIQLGSNRFGKLKVWVETLLISYLFFWKLRVFPLAESLLGYGFLAAIILAALSIIGHFRRKNKTARS